MFNPADTRFAARESRKAAAAAGSRWFRAGRSVVGSSVPGRSRPGTACLVEAGGQHIRGFRRGLDYAFVGAPLKAVRGRGACYPAAKASWILVPAPGDVPSAGLW